MYEVFVLLEGEIFGVMGFFVVNNCGDVYCGFFNVFFLYSVVVRFDGFGEGLIGMVYSGFNQYYDQYGSGNLYLDQFFSQLGGGLLIIWDVMVWRNICIENLVYYL